MGFTLVELLVMLGIFGILTTLLLGVVLNTANNAKVVRQATDLNEESRLVMNRLSRELRQASRILSVVNPDADAPDGTERLCSEFSSPCFNQEGNVAVTFQVDFNSDGVIQFSGSDPEQLTYCYERSAQRLLLQATSGLSPACPSPSAQQYPILSANVSRFKLSYRSSDYRCDTNLDGVVTWREIETASSPCPAVAGDLLGGISALDAELSFIDQIVVDLSVLTPPRTQRYRSRIDLRNRVV
ncbi:MAG: PulJ/GspJ family protein [Actinomycetota bacterium]